MRSGSSAMCCGDDGVLHVPDDLPDIHGEPRRTISRDMRENPGADDRPAAILAALSLWIPFGSNPLNPVGGRIPGIVGGYSYHDCSGNGAADLIGTQPKEVREERMRQEEHMRQRSRRSRRRWSIGCTNCTSTGIPPSPAFRPRLVVDGWSGIALAFFLYGVPVLVGAGELGEPRGFAPSSSTAGIRIICTKRFFPSALPAVDESDGVVRSERDRWHRQQCGNGDDLDVRVP